MIYVKREPADLKFVTSKNFEKNRKEELDKAKLHFSAVPVTGSFDFKSYKNELIKKKLIELFKGKCAYCDSTVVHISAGDIEHFRPKSIYWWLCCDWDNLFFACEKCNRSGKSDAWPLFQQVLPVTDENNIAAFLKEDSELRLLLNPCKENPEHFFEYDMEQALIKVNENVLGKQREKEMAEESVRTMQLQRIELVEERKKTLLLLQLQLKYAAKAVKEYNKVYNYPAGVRDEFEKRMKEELKKLMEFNRPERQYLGMVRQVLRSFFTENNIPLPDSLKTI